MSNTTTITGNLTREPEIRYTREGQATAQLVVAVSRRWQDRNHPGVARGDLVPRRRVLARLG
jgi:single-stranded DNA-binding protein